MSKNLLRNLTSKNSIHAIFLYTKGMTTEEIKKLAELSRLSLDEADIESYRKDFEGILKYIEPV